VNVASRMESHGLPMKVQVSQQTFELTQNEFIYDKREAIEMKGKGFQDTYLIESFRDSDVQSTTSSDNLPIAGNI
jgi:class 3 adenylate cyclase